MRRWMLAGLTALLACGGETGGTATQDAAVTLVDAGQQGGQDAAADVVLPKPADLDQPGPWGIGVANFEAKDPARNRTLQLTIWYPAQPTPDPGTPPAELFYPGNADLAAVYAKAPKACVNDKARGKTDAVPAPPSAFQGGLWPLVAFSHCSGCFRAASHGLAERLASHGFAVIAADHPPNTLFDQLKGKAESVTVAMLATRVADVRFALDVALNPTAAELPQALRGRFDAQRVGMYGHSFGALTTGSVLAQDARVKAGLAVAAPLSSPMPAGPDLTSVDKPALLLLAREDNSIFEIGNQIMRQNYADLKGPAWLVEVADAGHFTFSDTAELQPSWHPGCGTDKRQTDPEQTFAYLEPGKGRAIGARVVVAFFARWLKGVPDAMEALELPWAGTVTVEGRD